MKVLALILLSALMIAKLSGQVRVDRYLEDSGSAFHTCVGVKHYAGDNKFTVSRIEITWGQPVIQEIESDMDAYGGFFISNDCSSILVAGRQNLATAFSGRVELYAYDAENKIYELANQYVENGRDYAGITNDVNVGQLYLYDCVNLQILTSPYLCCGSLPQNYSVIVGPQDLAQIDNADEKLLRLRPDGNLVLAPCYQANQMDSTYYIILGNPILVEEIINIGRLRASIINSKLIRNQTSISISSAPYSQVELLRADAAYSVIGAAITDGNGYAELVLSSPLAMGGVYVAHKVGTDAVFGPFVTPVLSWGEPDILDNSVEIEGFRCARALRFCRNSSIRISFRVVPGSNCETVSYPGMLMVGTENDVSNIGGQWVLFGSYYYSETITLNGDSWALKNGLTDGSINLEIPDDPLMVGAICCFQWWVYDGTPITKVSDIIGMVIRDSMWLPTEYAPGGRGGNRGSGPNLLIKNGRESERILQRWWISTGAVRR